VIDGYICIDIFNRLVGINLICCQSRYYTTTIDANRMYAGIPDGDPRRAFANNK
jgi:hypothetical protein